MGVPHSNQSKIIRSGRELLRKSVTQPDQINSSSRHCSIRSDALVDRIEQGFATNGFGLWAVEVDGQFAGFTGLNRTSFTTPMGPHVEIGWRLAKWACGHGYATEAAARVLAVAFENFGMAEVFSFTTETNTKSEGVMQRINMSRRVDLDFDHPNTPGWWGAKHIVYQASVMDS